MKMIAVILSILVSGSSAFAQSSPKFPSTACLKSIEKAVMKKVPHWLEPSMSDTYEWDKKANDYANKYTGYFRASVALNAQECYEEYEVKTKLEYRDGAKTPSCKIISVIYVGKDCA